MCICFFDLTASNDKLGIPDSSSLLRMSLTSLRMNAAADNFLCLFHLLLGKQGESGLQLMVGRQR